MGLFKPGIRSLVRLDGISVQFTFAIFMRRLPGLTRLPDAVENLSANDLSVASIPWIKVRCDAGIKYTPVVCHQR